MRNFRINYSAIVSNWALLVLAPTLFARCATSTTVTPTLTDPDTFATVNVYHLRSTSDWENIYIDDQLVATLPYKTYTSLRLNPGEHTIVTNKNKDGSKFDTSLTFSVEAGKEYYLNSISIVLKRPSPTPVVVGAVLGGALGAMVGAAIAGEPEFEREILLVSAEEGKGHLSQCDDAAEYILELRESL